MKNRIENKFQELKRKKQKALVTFVTAGDPHLHMTPEIVLHLEDAGADIIELGMPFSDPMADGPVIQKSSERALKSGTTLGGIFEAVRQVRKKSEVPLLLMGYFNPVFHYGIEKFYSDASEAGVDATLIVDLPPEEGEDARTVAKTFGISLVYLLAPTSDSERISLVNRKGSGFIYYVSLTGVTGAALRSKSGLNRNLKEIREQARLPVCVGFGIKSAEQARSIAPLADGIVVGSALVDCFGKYKPNQALQMTKRLVRQLARVVHT